jgi:hypothetical protein
VRCTLICTLYPDLYLIVLTLLDISDVGQQLIEDNIVSVSRQMIDKEASVPKSNARQNGRACQDEADEMEE